VGGDYSLSNRRVFDSVASCDGITLDEKGNVYSVSFSTGVVHVRDADGKKLGVINIPGQQMTNVGFGGADFKTLFMITNKGLYKLPMKVKGYKSGQPSVSLGRLLPAPLGAAETAKTGFRADGRLIPAVPGNGESGALVRFKIP
jgi:hypothetical protein